MLRFHISLKLSHRHSSHPEYNRVQHVSVTSPCRHTQSESRCPLLLLVCGRNESYFHRALGLLQPAPHPHFLFVSNSILLFLLYDRKLCRYPFVVDFLTHTPFSDNGILAVKENFLYSGQSRFVYNDVKQGCD